MPARFKNTKISFYLSKGMNINHQEANILTSFLKLDWQLKLLEAGYNSMKISKIKNHIWKGCSQGY